MFYEIHYSHFVENQNARNAKIRHTERNRTIEDLLAGKKTCPEETIYQFGTLDEHASVEDLVLVVTEFIAEFHERFGAHVHLLDWALHLDESTPHIHERHVFDCENKHGEVAPQQEKALEALGLNWRKKRSTATASIWKNRTSSLPSRRSSLPPSRISWTS